MATRRRNRSANRHFKHSRLLADIIENPEKPMDWHAHKDEHKRKHGITRPNIAIKAFDKGGVIKNNFPNFFHMGFTAQAFVDITLSKGITKKQEEDIKEKLRTTPGIISIYIVFGQIDLRCKIVGYTLIDINELSIQIREIDGIESSSTNIVLDDTDHQQMIKTSSELIIKNARKIEKNLTEIISEHKDPDD